jgi:hypothetical protein
MKFKNVLLLLVLGCALLAAAVQAAPPDPAPAPAPLVLSPAASTCTAAGATLLPAPATPLAIIPRCGACSTGGNAGGCANAPQGAGCGVEGMFILSCTNQGSLCSQDNRPFCACTSGEQ